MEGQGSLAINKRMVDKLSFLLQIIGIYLQHVSKILGINNGYSILTRKK